MIKKLLIANRGEIAVRIMSTCRKLGIQTVAVYSTADRDAKFVAMADEAFCIGPPEAAQSYLDGEKIISVAKRASADAIHPGYGFLSENAQFAELCAEHDLIFVGPPVDVVRQMGSKIESKKIAAQCDVPTVPGYFGDDQDPRTLSKQAQQIGMPLLIKASAGGGGRGMRVVRHIDDFTTQLTLATSEAKTAFGDSKVLLERYLEQPRHLEVQVLGDQHGHVIHLFERECSIQRNHQKVIEEAPAAFLDSAAREKLFTNALKLARHIGYSSAGTVEFIVDSKTQEVFFLEMNTRLQVEHPVTECITGIDLVEWQLRIASGEALTLQQDDLSVTGWAIEARVTAEDPSNNYLPQIGTLSFYQEPQGKGIRVDSGIQQGSDISPYYDSMISKTIAYGNDRMEARARLIDALNNYSMAGVGNNLVFLRDLLQSPNFTDGPLTTNYISKTFADGWLEPKVDIAKIQLLCALACLSDEVGDESEHRSPWHIKRNWRLLARADLKPLQQVSLRGSTGEITRVEFIGSNGNYQVSVVSAVDNEALTSTYSVDEVHTHESFIEAEIDGQLFRYRYDLSAQQVLLFKQSKSFTFQRVPKRYALATEKQSALTSEAVIRTPMPGVINAVHAKPGDAVEVGDVLIVMEAMKLVQNLSASVKGKVHAVHCVQGQNVAANELLIEITEDEKASST